MRVIVPAEMLEAGVEMLEECRRAKLDQATTALQVYMAMRAVEEVLEEPNQGSVH
jgi:hypothetical protein